MTDYDDPIMQFLHDELESIKARGDGHEFASSDDEHRCRRIIGLIEQLALEDIDPEFCTTLLIHTEEPVTPDFLAQRVAQACGGRALRAGESVQAANSEKRFIITAKTLADELGDLFP